MLPVPSNQPATKIRSDSPAPHAPTLNYSYRMPSPPRLVIPPPLHDAGGVPEFSIGRHGSPNGGASGFGNADFLKTVTYGDFLSSKDSMIEWKYDQRRVAQAILPFLYLGPVSSARDPDFLKREGITMVVAARNTLSAHAKLLEPKAPRVLGLDYFNIDVAGNQELIAAFPRATEAINQHLSMRFMEQQIRNKELASREQAVSSALPGKVLVFCESGNERSAAVVTAYIMAMYSVDVVEAVQIVQTRRFSSCFDDNLRNLLSYYDDILRARRDISQPKEEQAPAEIEAPAQPGVVDQPPSSSGRHAKKQTKRTLDEACEDDMDVDEGDPRDRERFQKREGHAPFEDARD